MHDSWAKEKRRIKINLSGNSEDDRELRGETEKIISRFPARRMCSWIEVKNLTTSLCWAYEITQWSASIAHRPC